LIELGRRCLIDILGGGLFGRFMRVFLIDRLAHDHRSSLNSIRSRVVLVRKYVRYIRYVELLGV
jgi:hypothetical protein